jgi:hypothetical protein
MGFNLNKTRSFCVLKLCGIFEANKMSFLREISMFTKQVRGKFCWKKTGNKIFSSFHEI